MSNKNYIKEITLFFIFDSPLSLKKLILYFSALKMLTGQTPYIILSQKVADVYKKKKGDPIGVKITLQKKNLYIFLKKIIYEILPRINIKNFSLGNYLTSNLSIFHIKELLFLNEFKNHYFFFKNLENLKISILFYQEKKFIPFFFSVHELPFFK